MYNMLGKETRIREAVLPEHSDDALLAHICLLA